MNKMQINIPPTKPLGMKAYGHIPHLPGSRLGPGDHKCTEGQAIMCTMKRKEKSEEIFVQEKLDGSCCAIALIDGVVTPLTRVGYRTEDSHYELHHRFGAWVYAHQERFLAVLQEGERLVGEWLIQAHGTRYALPHEPFVVFDLMREQTRLPYDMLQKRLIPGQFIMPRLIHRGDPISIKELLTRLEPSGHGALEPVEGAVWRIERKGQVLFLAKWVRPEKVDGCYLDLGAPIWNTYPEEQEAPNE